MVYLAGLVRICSVCVQYVQFCPFLRVLGHFCTFNLVLKLLVCGVLWLSFSVPGGIIGGQEGV